MWKCVFVAVFHHVNLNFFFKNNKSLEYLNVLLRVFFGSGVFQTFEVDFWLLLKAQKVLPPKRYWREKRNFFKISFSILHRYESYKLKASRIPFIKEKSGPFLQP